MSKQRKLDIKQVLEAIDTRDFDFYKNLSNEQKDEFTPFVVMQFLSGADSYSIEMTQEVLNKNFTEKSKHKDLFYRLCCVMGEGKKKFHPYNKPPKANRKRSESILVRLLTEYRNDVLSEEEAIMIVRKNANAYDINFWVMIAESMDWSNELIKKLEQELKTIF